MRGVTLKATEQPVDTSTTAGKALFGMLGVFAEFETNLRRQQHMEGIATAKDRGVYTGRKPGIDPPEVRCLRAEEKLSPPTITGRLRMAQPWCTGSCLRNRPTPDHADQRRLVAEDRPAHAFQARHGRLENLALAERRTRLAHAHRRCHLH
jgi:hypothetical protein